MKKLLKELLVLLCLIFMITSYSPVEAKSIDQTQMIKEYMKNALDLYNIPGASLAVLKDGEIFFQGNWGVLSDGSPVTSDTPFLIGSLSKPITSLAVMILVEEGKVKLDEPVQTYIPNFKYQSGSLKPITVRNLLEQTSGISEYEGLKVTDREYTGQDPINQAVNELNGIKLAHEPGETYEYNSANYLLLGAIIEAVTNQSFSEFLNDHIFSPLDMNHTAADYKNAVAKGYLPGFRSWFGKPVKGDGFYDNSGAPYGYISSSSNDLAKFLKFMLYGGSIVNEKHLNLLKTAPKENRSYGFGWHFFNPFNAQRYPYHGGATPHFRAEMFFIPEQNFGAVLLTNKYHAMEDHQVTRIMEGIRSIVNKTSPSDLPKQNYTIQWILLGIVILTMLVSALCLIRLKKKSMINKKLWSAIGVVLIILAVGLIPILAYSMATPWHTIKLFTPDVAFLVICITGILAIDAIVILTIAALKGKSK